MIRVALVDDQAIVRAGLARILSPADGFDVVAECADGRQAVQELPALRPVVVLMDIRMPVLDGLSATRQIIGNGGPGGPRVIVLTTYDLDEYVYEALRAGACGFLLKHAPPEELLFGVRAAADGGALLSPAVTARLLAEFAGRRPAADREPAELDRLTPREREVLDLVVRGMSNGEIARTLFVSHSTVKTHLTHVLDKLGLRDRVQAVVYGYEHGLVEPGRTG
jgi:DNA-binding NarL/FixJ family response regulator